MECRVIERGKEIGMKISITGLLLFFLVQVARAQQRDTLGITAVKPRHSLSRESLVERDGQGEGGMAVSNV